MASGTQVGHQTANLGKGALNRVKIENLAADMQRKAAHGEALLRGQPAINGRRFADRHAKFILPQSGRDFGMGSGINIGIDPQHGRRRLAHRPGKFGNRHTFFFELDIELANPGIDRFAQFVRRFADAGKDNVGGRHARGERALHLTDRDDVRAKALARQDAEYGEIGICLDRKGNMDIG